MIIGSCRVQSAREEGLPVWAETCQHFLIFTEEWLKREGGCKPPDPMGDGVLDHVEKEFLSYLTCGILAHGFARARHHSDSCN